MPQSSKLAYGERCHMLLCCLLYDMEVNGDGEKVGRLVELFVRHFAPTIVKPSTAKNNRGQESAAFTVSQPAS
ncbi:MAG: hypothetical protein U5K75_03930 [Ahrensia sp.]|nr:hypothetical protein [Ahrensia sp.]